MDLPVLPLASELASEASWLAGWLSAHVHAIHLSLEGLLVLLVIYVLAQRRRPTRPSPPVTPLNDKEFDARLQQYLRNRKSLDQRFDAMGHRQVVVSKAPTTHLVMRFEDEPIGTSRRVLNLSTPSFLGLNYHPDCLEVAQKCIQTYGVGACGPRGFYGTLPPHTEFETAFARHVGFDQALLISSSFATLSTVFPTFARNCDVLFVDAKVQFSLWAGVGISRSAVHIFDHNDPADCRRKLQALRDSEAKKPKKPAETRRFLLLEGVSPLTGQICRLPEFVALAKEFCLYIVLDDSYAFGVLGARGRGSCEHHNVSPRDIAFLCCDLGTALGSAGGVCCTREEYAASQRISTTGYVFSASPAPYVISAATKAIELIGSDLVGAPRRTALSTNAGRLRRGLAAVPYFDVLGNSMLPVVPVVLKNPAADSNVDDRKLEILVQRCVERGVMCARIRTLETVRVEDFDHPGKMVPRPPPVKGSYQPPPMLRFCVSSEHTADDIDQALAVVAAESQRIFAESAAH